MLIFSSISFKSLNTEHTSITHEHKKQCGDAQKKGLGEGGK